MKKLLLLIPILILLTATVFAGVKRADLAGRWYPASKEALIAELNSYLDSASTSLIDGKIIALISPHAGFTCSGPVAAYGFNAIKDRDIKTIIVIGFSHRVPYDFIAILEEDAFETPLGAVGIDRELTDELVKNNPSIHGYPVAFAGENSVEMQIPFLQMVLKDFKVVLIAIGEQSFENSRLLGKALYEALKNRDNYLLVASTDMCHYLPYAEAERSDKKTISLIEELNPDKLYRESLAEGHRFMCGYGALCATMIAAEKLGGDKVKILKYANSGDTLGDRTSVVGYLSAVLIKKEGVENAVIAKRPEGPTKQSQTKEIASAPSVPRNDTQGDGNMLNETQRKKMLELARNSITHYLKTGKPLEVKENDPVLNKEMGAFVTLHERGEPASPAKRGELRGCIGNMIGRGPFYLTVRDMAIEAATGDPRFRPVSADEMKNIDIEISALSPMERITDPNKIEVGRHGVLVRSGFASGVYLPQVATETGWNRDQFMNSLCEHKAGMPRDAWKKGGCDIYIFTAEVFGEKK